ncbi:hypothetical protein [Flavobacterium beibuense]|uniref:Uncharacterized protein n=1 Tax=Flavobacterium beibuense TaxID=657326 RepID=A0A444W826_9FLAO|nr:hypothetical protein [Flavobacterium beibuense]RYJ42057.1 hypothetical protein NU09_2461 [Flavobacterium beibuense]
MDYPIRIQDSHPLREQLETLLNGLLHFIDAGSVYVSDTPRQPTVVTMILKKNCGQSGIMLERLSEKLDKEAPKIIFRFIDETIVTRGFKEGSPFLVAHCTLKELVHYEPGNKLFFPQQLDIDALLRQANSRSSDDLNRIGEHYAKYLGHIDKGNTAEAAIDLYSAIWSIYASFATFFTGYLEEYYSYPEFNEVYEITNRYASELREILDKDSEAGRNIIAPLYTAYTCKLQKHPIAAIEKADLEAAEAKCQHLLAELENYYYRFFADAKSKLAVFNQSLYGGASILTERLTSNYFVERALGEISQVIQGFVKVRAVYCFGYFLIEDDTKKRKPFGRKLPDYHFYLLVLNSQHRHNLVPELQALIKKQFAGRYTVTILQHRAQYLRKQTTNQKHFINAVATNGLEVYNSSYSPFYCISVGAGRDIEFRKNYWNDRMRIAEGFLTLVQDEYPNELPLLINALLQEAVQQMAVGLLDLFMGYHPNIYSTNYLLRLLDCIPGLPKLFSNSEEDRRLRQLLSANIDMLKHKNPGQETIEDSNRLYKKYREFYDAILVEGSRELERLEQTEPKNNSDTERYNNI